MKSEYITRYLQMVAKKNWVLSVFLGTFVFLFWGGYLPHALSYAEQYQLFLWTPDYLLDCLNHPAGLVEWLETCLVQFYYLPWLGAMILALLFIGYQRMVASWLKAESFLLSFIPTIFLFWAMGDLDVLLSFPIAMIVAMAVAKIRLANRWLDICKELVLVPLTYWLIGPMAWLYVALRIVVDYKRFAWLPIWLLAVQLLLWHTVLAQVPLQSVIGSMGYYRSPSMVPMLWIVPLSVLLCVLADRFRLTQVVKWPVQAVAVVVLGWLAVTRGYADERYELVWQDYQIRNEHWDDIIQRAEQKTVETAFWSNSVNLALAERRQLADHMFDFYQSGIDALLMNMVRNPFSNIPAAEAFFRLGMVNSAQRYMFDMQESINNGRKSGRFTQRIAECYIINGKYNLARKHLALLKHSLFYSGWAEEAETYLGQEEKIAQHPVWGRLRQIRQHQDFLFYYPEMASMLGSLFNGNRSNTMALDYFVAQVLLNGDAPTFQQALPWVQQYGGYMQMPRGYQDAMNCIQRQGQVPASPYAAFISRMLAKAQEQQNNNVYETAH
ncbi:DUF6057 family protein [Prevotella sp. P6B1]|uniref:DUF6057 family protein n=1 Tax=Prevotella sp. P6B1 TaxID=1410613 RepID=UPI00051BD29A|nr:DUF6057 family protein [Prevotella sp. P6B1]